MPGRGKYIDGIFNYCDRWCERCPFTSRCRSFAMEQSMNRLMAKKERQNAEYWAAMEKVLGEAIDPAIKEADQLFGDVKNDTPPAEPDDDALHDIEKHGRAERNHPLGRRSDEYIHFVDQFFDAHQEKAS